MKSASSLCVRNGKESLDNAIYTISGVVTESIESRQASISQQQCARRPSGGRPLNPTSVPFPTSLFSFPLPFSLQSTALSHCSLTRLYHPPLLLLSLHFSRSLSLLLLPSLGVDYLPSPRSKFVRLRSSRTWISCALFLTRLPHRNAFFNRHGFANLYPRSCSAGKHRRRGT